MVVLAKEANLKCKFKNKNKTKQALLAQLKMDFRDKPSTTSHHLQFIR